MTQPTPAQVAHMVDHTLLKPESTPTEVAALMAEATRLGAYSVCVSPSQLPVVIPTGSRVLVATVVGFPSGAVKSVIKAAEAGQAVKDGAHEVDMVINLGAVKAGDWDLVQADIAAVRTAVPSPTVLKVIIESAALTDEEIVGACKASEAAGADFVKTSTGFNPAGGASEHALELMAQTVGTRLGIKASGGIRDGATALKMIAAGATRLGLSGTESVLSSLGETAAAQDQESAGY